MSLVSHSALLSRGVYGDTNDLREHYYKEVKTIGLFN